VKQIEVTILGQSYLLGCPEGGEALLQQAVSTVDQEMSAIRDAGRVKARERMAVLAALNLAYRLAEKPAPPADVPADSPSVPASAATGAADEDLQRLIDRIDAALGGDGHLL
jgi:cell division protein ZapA